MPNKGYKQTEEHHKKLLKAITGKVRSLESRKRYSKSKMGDRNPTWKGDKVKYAGLHLWIQRQLGKAAVCVNGHIASVYYWANISGKYKRDVNDFRQLCNSCNGKEGWIGRKEVKRYRDNLGRYIIKI